MAPPTTYFKLINASTGSQYPIITDKDYGGFEWHYGSSGKGSPFRATIPVFDDDSSQVNPTFTTGDYFAWYSAIDTADRQYTTNNGWALRGGDEIYLAVQAPDDLNPNLIYNGNIIDVEIIVSEEKERLLTISGNSWGDFWLEGRMFDADYRTKTTRISDALHDIVTATHPSMRVVGIQEPLKVLNTAADIHAYLESREAGSDVLIQKEYNICKCSEAIQEICALAHLEYFVNWQKQLIIYPSLIYFEGAYSGGFSNGTVIHETNIVGKPKFRWTDDGYHYDAVLAGASSEMFAPNNASPTGTAYCDHVEYWTAAMMNGNLSTDTLYGNFCQKSAVIGGCYPAIVFGWPLYPLPDFDNVAVVLGSPTTKDNSTGVVTASPFLFNMIEHDWDSLQFGFQNNFNITGFFIKLNHGRHGATGSWLSTNLVLNPDWPQADPSKDVNKFWNLRLPTATRLAREGRGKYPSARGYDTNFWVAIDDAAPNSDGTPSDTFRIDEIEFQFYGTKEDLKFNSLKPTVISYLHFSKTPQVIDTIDSPRIPPRVMIHIDRTETSSTDLLEFANKEKERIKDSMLTGTVTVDVPTDPWLPNPIYQPGYANMFSYQNCMSTMPGNNVTLDLPYYGFDGLPTGRSYRRVDHIANNVSNNEWLCSLAFGAFNTTNTFDIFEAFNQIVKPDDKQSETSTKVKPDVGTGQLGSAPAGQIKGKHNLRGYR